MWPLVTVLIYLTYTRASGYVFIQEYDVEVNEVKIPTVDISSMRIAQYEFFQDELISITCRRRNDKNDIYLRLSYYTQHGNCTILTESVLKGSVKIDLKMKGGDEGKYIDCISTEGKEAPKESHVTRVLFSLKANKATVGIQVNGLILTPVKGLHKNVYYKYYYYDEEPLEIKSFKHGQKHVIFDCDIRGDNLKRFSKLNNTWSDTPEIHLSTVLHNEKIVFNCTVGMYTHSYSTRDNTGTNSSITLQLIPKTVDFDRPFIIGLSAANILQQYRKNNTDIIFYEYDGNKTDFLSLGCWSKTIIPKWDYTGSEVDVINVNSHQVKYISNVLFNVNSAKFKLNVHQNTSVIKCVTTKVGQKSNTIIVTLMKKILYPELPSEFTAISLLGIVAACGAILALGFLTIWTIVLCKRKQHLSNLTNDIPPRQNEDTPQEARLSASPLNRIATDSISGAIGKMTKPIPKPRKLIEPTYADLQFTESQHLEHSTTRSELHQNPPENYAEIVLKTNKTNPDISTYENQNVSCVPIAKPRVFGSPDYVNTTCKTDYAEPAYCEVTVTKR